MSNEREIFERAIQLENSAERIQYLNETCGADQELRDRVNELVEEHFQTGDFILQRNPDPSQEETREQLDREFVIGTNVGRYKLMEQIGHGGMGVVFVAEQQEPIRRLVALKIVKPGMDSRQILNRFKAEQQALAMMDHPNIAKVLDAGQTDSGRPYFVMELVRGVPVTKFCNQKRIGNHERLKLFQDICRAIQHAHQKGIIHRDIKPGNVLVTLHDDKPVVKVIDFGVAKALHQSLTKETVYTGLRNLVGTPLYMSPEQAEMSGLDIDTRTDIYSLGVLLYELLTGELPFSRERLHQAGFDEMRRIIREEEPQKPSTKVSSLGDSTNESQEARKTDPKRLSTFLRGDLDWIVMKTLEKDRNRRYETATGLAADVQRFMDNEPVVAGPPSSAYKFKKFVARNRAAVVAGSIVILALIAGIIGVTYGLVTAITQTKIADQAAKHAKRSAEMEQDARIDAERKADLAREAVKDFLSAVGDRRLKNIPMMDRLREQLLQEAVKFNKIFVDEDNSETAKLETGKAHMQLANIYMLLENAHETTASMKAGKAIFEKRFELNPEDTEARYWLAEAYYQLAYLPLTENNFPEAKSLLEQALGHYQALFDSDKSDSRFIDGVASCNQFLGRIHQSKAEYAEAEARLNKALDLIDSAPEFQDLKEFRSRKAHILMELGSNYGMQQQAVECGDCFHGALEITQALNRDYPDERDYIELLNLAYERVAYHQHYEGNHQLADEARRNSIATIQILVDNYPHIPDYEDELSMAKANLAVGYAIRGEMQVSLELFEESLEVAKQLHFKFPESNDFADSYARCLKYISVHYNNMNRPKDALEPFQLSYDLFTSMGARNPSAVFYPREAAECAYNIASVHNTIGDDLDEAEKWIGIAIKTVEDLLTKAADQAILHHRHGKYYWQRGALKENLNDMDGAEKDLLKAADIQTNTLTQFGDTEEHSRHLANTKQQLGSVYQTADRLDEAKQSLEEAITIQSKNVERFPGRLDHPRELAKSKRLLAEVHDRIGESQKAIDCISTSIDEIQLEIDKAENPEVRLRELRLDAYELMIKYMIKAKRLDDAIVACQQVEKAIELEIVDESEASNRALAQQVINQWAVIELSQADVDKALGRLVLNLEMFEPNPDVYLIAAEGAADLLASAKENKMSPEIQTKIIEKACALIKQGKQAGLEQDAIDQSDALDEIRESEAYQSGIEE